MSGEVTYRRMTSGGIVWIEDQAFVDARDKATELRGKCDAQQQEIERMHKLLAQRVAIDVTSTVAPKGGAS